PSAARAVYESILWKPAIRWRVRRIEVLRPIRFINLRRNEVKSKIQTPTVQQAMSAGSGALGINVEDDRVQRAGYFLRDVAYRLHADLSLAPHCTEPLAKYTEMFARRASKGQCVNQPYLGCREFAADFRLVTADSPPAAPIPDTRELGWMLHDLDFTHPADPQPRFFNARMEQGVIEVPPFEEARG
ncbi:MAG TPA: type I-C CRISPR-associated protein Cas5c, partial [Acidovorax sp.]|nr:type I-C CRISPR-associated protein Cas5c [Acidovorax sp.]